MYHYEWSYTVSSSSPAVNPLVVHSYAAALWLIAKGFTPISASAEPTRGAITFLFPADARDAWQKFHRAKTTLDVVAQAARWGRS